MCKKGALGDITILHYTFAFVSTLFPTIITLTCYYTWFVLSDRYRIFLYNHLNATPFAPITISRYYMSGFTVAGFVMLADIFTNSLWSLSFRSNQNPLPLVKWWKAWLWNAPLLAIGTLTITMTQNQPVLPLRIALVMTGIVCGGTVLALIPGRLVIKSPTELFWLASASVGLTPALLLLRTVEVADIAFVRAPFVYTITCGMTIAGVGMSCLIAYWHSATQQMNWKAHQLIIGALCIAYLFTPAVHYLLFTPPSFRYISAMGNYFASNPRIQILCWIIMFLGAQVAVKCQRNSTQVCRCSTALTLTTLCKVNPDRISRLLLLFVVLLILISPLLGRVLPETLINMDLIPDHLTSTPQNNILMFGGSDTLWIIPINPTLKHEEG